MRSYDPELIAALAEGTLDSETAAALERRIASDPDAAAELAAQKAAIAVWREVEPPLMTTAESARLRANIAEALNLHPEASVVIHRRRTPWTTIAVAAATVVAAAVLLPLTLFSGPKDATSTRLAGDGADTSVREETQADEALLGAAPDGAEGTATEAAPLNGDLSEQTTAAGWVSVGGEQYTTWSDLADDLYSNPEALLERADPDLDACRADATRILGDPSALAVQIESPSETAIVWFTPLDDARIDRLVIVDSLDCTVLEQRP